MKFHDYEIVIWLIDSAELSVLDQELDRFQFYHFVSLRIAREGEIELPRPRTQNENAFRRSATKFPTRSRWIREARKTADRGKSISEVNNEPLESIDTGLSRGYDAHRVFERSSHYRRALND